MGQTSIRTLPKQVKIVLLSITNRMPILIPSTALQGMEIFC